MSNIDLVLLLVHNLDTIGGDDKNDEPHDYFNDKQLGNEVNIPTNNGQEKDDIEREYDNITV